MMPKIIPQIKIGYLDNWNKKLCDAFEKYFGSYF
jgi:hypothetical protein